MDATWIAFAFLCRWGGVYYTALLPARRAERKCGVTYLFGGGCCGDAMVATNKGKARR